MQARSIRGGFLLGIALGACNAPPGELLGEYNIAGELTVNTCGNAALPAPNPLQFDVEIRRIDDGEALWVHGNPPGSSGSLTDENEFEFRSEGTFNVSAPEQTTSSELLEMDPLLLANLDTFEEFEARALGPQAPCVLGISEFVRGRLMRDARSPRDAGAMAASAKPDLVGDNEIEIRATHGDCSLVVAEQGGPFDALPCRAHYELTGALVER